MKIRRQPLGTINMVGANIEKLKNRYPEGFSAEKSQHRIKGDL